MWNYKNPFDFSVIVHNWVDIIEPQLILFSVCVLFLVLIDFTFQPQTGKWFRKDQMFKYQKQLLFRQCFHRYNYIYFGISK